MVLSNTSDLVGRILPFRLLLCDFEDDVEFDRHPERKTGNADNQPDRYFVRAEDIAKQIRDSVRDLRLVEEVSRSCYEYAEPDDASHSIE